MKKYEKVKKNNEFNDIINLGTCFKNKYYYIYYKDSGLKYPTFGIAVSKKFGNAVFRNKVKRQMRAIVDNNKRLFKDGVSYIIMVRRAIGDASYKEMEDSLKSLLRKD